MKLFWCEPLLFSLSFRTVVAPMPVSPDVPDVPDVPDIPFALTQTSYLTSNALPVSAKRTWCRVP